MSRRQSLTEIPQSFHRHRGVLQSVECKVQLIAVWDRSQQISNRRRLMALQYQVAEGGEGTQGLRHLLAFDEQEAHMKPGTGKRLSRQRLRLRDFVFVMWEDKVFPTSVQIEAVAQFLHRHDRAFEVPAGASSTNRGFPESLSRLGRLPQRKVACAVFIVFVNVDAGPIEHPAEIFLLKFSILRILRDAEEIRTVIADLSDPLLHQPGHEFRHLWNMLGGAHHPWVLVSNHGAIFKKRLSLLPRVFLNPDSFSPPIAD